VPLCELRQGRDGLAVGSIAGNDAQGTQVSVGERTGEHPLAEPIGAHEAGDVPHAVVDVELTEIGDGNHVCAPGVSVERLDEAKTTELVDHLEVVLQTEFSGGFESRELRE
jgi:hypothetical protein